MNISFTKTHYLARIHRFDAGPVMLCEEMLSCSISRPLENPAHSFSMSLVGYGKIGEYYRDNEIKADDWIEIFHAVGPYHVGFSQEEKYGIPVKLKDGMNVNIRCKRRFLGRVERFERDITIKESTSMVRFSISGSSWAKTIVQQPSIILPYFEDGFPVTKFIKSQYKITDTPETNIKKLLDHFWANEQYELPSSLREVFGITTRVAREYNEKVGNLYKSKEISPTPTIYDITGIELHKCDGEVADWQMLTANTQMFQLLQQYKNPLLNEFWCDLDFYGYPRITMREFPYSEKRTIPSSLKDDSIRQYFDNLEPVVIDYSQWEQLKVGRSSHERYNWFACTSESHPTGSIVNQQATLYREGGIKLDEDSIRRYGLLRFEQGCMYSSYMTGEKPSTSFETLKKFTNLTEHWYKKNPDLLNGTVQLKNVFDLVLGKKLVITDIITNTGGTERHSEAYYVTAVTESWQAYSVANFDVTLVRGRVLNNFEVNEAKDAYKKAKSGYSFAGGF